MKDRNGRSLGLRSGMSLCRPQINCGSLLQPSACKASAMPNAVSARVGKHVLARASAAQRQDLQTRVAAFEARLHQHSTDDPQRYWILSCGLLLKGSKVAESIRICESTHPP